MTDRSVHRPLPLALVVGACGGMGLACARRLGQHHSLLLSDIDADALRQVAGQLADEGVSVRARACDVTRDDSVASLMAEVDEAGPLAVVAHVAALSPVAGDGRRIVAVNLQGPARIADALLPRLRAGVAVFVSSIAAHFAGDVSGLLPLLDEPLAPGFVDALEAALGGAIDPGRAYALSKHALNRLCRRRAAAWGALGHRIVSLSPGLIATPMGEREFVASPQKWGLLERTPLRRQGALPEVVDALEFLVSARASFITGTDLVVDGGLTGAAQD